MSNGTVDWLFTVVRVAGASFPGASSLVQLQSELDSKHLSQRVRQLEDPISFLHEDVPDLARTLYEAVQSQDRGNVKLEPEVVERFRRPLARLEAHGCVACHQGLNDRLPRSVQLTDPSFVMYMCALCEPEKRMNALIRAVDQCEPGQWIDGDELHRETGIPLAAIRACFEIYEASGYGLRSKTLQQTRYMGKV